MGTILIRPATSADARGIANVDVTAWQWAYAGFLPPTAITTVDSARRATVADDGAIRGFVAYGPAPDDNGGELYALYVDRDVVGTCVVRAPHDRALDDLRTAGHGLALVHDDEADGPWTAR